MSVVITRARQGGLGGYAKLCQLLFLSFSHKKNPQQIKDNLQLVSSVVHNVTVVILFASILIAPQAINVMYPCYDVFSIETVLDPPWMLFAVHNKCLKNKIQIKQLVKQDTDRDMTVMVKDRERATSFDHLRTCMSAYREDCLLSQ